MALTVNEPFNTPYGISLNGTYWRWISLSISVPDQRATGILYGYVDEAAFNDGKSPVGQKQYTIEGDDFLSLGASIEPNLSDSFYAYVRGHDDYFQDAIDR